MAYYLNLFSPDTYETFTNGNREISGFRVRQRKAAQKLKPGDKFVCYMTKLSRWVGVLEILSTAFEDSSPVFYEDNDPFIIRFKVRPLCWLEQDKAVPIRTEEIWNTLSFTREYSKESSAWTGKFRGSLGNITNADGLFLEEFLTRQYQDQISFPFTEQDRSKLAVHRIHRADKIVNVSVPDDNNHLDDETKPEGKSRESIKIQALLAAIGSKMGMQIWVPRNDKGAICAEPEAKDVQFVNILPLNYNDTTLKTIEQIDVLWLKGRSIVRAFEVEHTTSIYSGILRMADLIALQPNMDIKLHLVAPPSRREKVFQEIRRPVFSLLEKGPLSESCTFISYDALHELSRQKHLAHLSDSVLEEYTEDAE